jgi:hypothetical protein
MDKKYGVYICTGCGIGDALDIEALSGVAGEEGFPVQTHPFLCSQAGVDIIKKDTEEKGINTMVIAACSRRVNFDTFRFDGCIVERVNLREGVVWSHPRDPVSGPDRRAKGRRSQLRSRPDDGRRLSAHGHGPGEESRSARSLPVGNFQPENSGDRRRHNRYLCRSGCGQGRLRGNDCRKRRPARRRRPTTGASSCP